MIKNVVFSSPYSHQAVPIFTERELWRWVGAFLTFLRDFLRWADQVGAAVWALFFAATTPDFAVVIVASGI